MVKGMKALLVQPPIEDFYDTSIRTYPLGLLYLATAIRHIADVTILDARTAKKPHPVRHYAFPELEEFYRDNRYTPFSFFSRYSRFGLSESAIRDAIRRERPDLVGIASMCSAYEQQAVEVARIAKEVNPDTVTVMGGIHATLFPARLLSCPEIDYCVRGEGETPLFKLISSLSGRHKSPEEIEGLCFKKTAGFHIANTHVETSIDALPHRRLLDGERYRINKRRYTFFLTSRGCPFSCAFCGKPHVPYRRRRLAAIEEEMAECGRLGIEAIDFEDDMLNLDKEFFTRMLRLLVGRGFTLSAMNGIYPATMDIPTLHLMSDAGFKRLNFSLVDIFDPVIQAQKRRSHGEFLRLLPYLEASPFLTEVHFIIGLPGQTPENVIETLLFLMEKRLLLGPSVFYPAPGSRLYEERRPGEGDIDPIFMRSSVMLPVNPLFPRPVTYTLVKLVRFINYVKGLADRRTGIERLSDLADGNGTGGDDKREKSIVRHLLENKEFIAYDTKRQGFVREPHDPELVRLFFRRAKGMRVKSYRTGESVLIDV